MKTLNKIRVSICSINSLCQNHLSHTFDPTGYTRILILLTVYVYNILVRILLISLTEIAI